MSTKMSSLNTSANNSPTTTMNTSATATQANATPTAVRIKKELPSDEIKEFAESTMNELLGWYGFDSVDRLDISAKTSKLLQTAGLLNTQQHLERRRNRSSRANTLMQIHQQQNEHLRSSLSNTVTNNNANCNNNSRTNYRGNESTASDHDTRSSRDDDSKSPNSTGILAVSGATNALDEKLDFQNCCWCRRPVPENAPEFLTTSDGPRYCSESCFTQSRRASFKKAKTCDWCKHIRHAVSYVDFHDGASQLQFCSDKCLNQYKMQIFCKETQAHLDMNPHLKEQGLDAANNGANLITPDLWLKNCRSRSASPESTVSTSPGPNCATTNVSERSSARSNTPMSPPKLASATPVSNNSLHSANVPPYKPIISVAPVSKLMSKSPGIIASRQSPKHNRKKRPIKATCTAEIPSNRSEVKTNCSATGQVGGKAKPTLIGGPHNETNRPNMNQTGTPSLTQFAASCVQDLHMNVPPLSPMLENPASHPSTPHNLPNTTNTGRPTFFATPPNIAGPPPPPPGQPSAGFVPRPPFMHNHPALPRFFGNFSSFPQPPNAAMIPPDLMGLNASLPPVTVMVPYPVIIPLPIPIPVPLPVVDFYKAHLNPEERKKFEESRNIKKENETQPNGTNSEEPLDFTKTKERMVNVAAVSNEATHHVEDVEEVEEFTTKEEETETSRTTTSASPVNEAPSTPTTTSHACIINTDEAAATTHMVTDENNDENSNNRRLTTTNCNNANDEANEDNHERLPKLKITRLQTKRLIQTKESECSRPLRKRKRIIDCDFQKIAAANSRSEMNADDEMDANEQHRTSSTEIELNNKGQTTTTTNNNNK
ncbi:sine oculis-binding protein [Haematobia irritans]|uniref:sine oculis-binding protein n=1 Tax=Haematobia irritans TaxID=7368 RepID=UPI003F4FE70C